MIWLLCELHGESADEGVAIGYRCAVRLRLWIVPIGREAQLTELHHALDHELAI